MVEKIFSITSGSIVSLYRGNSQLADLIGDVNVDTSEYTPPTLKKSIELALAHGSQLTEIAQAAFHLARIPVTTEFGFF